MDFRTLAFCQLMGFPIKPLKVKLLAEEQKATECCLQEGPERGTFAVGQRTVTLSGGAATVIVCVCVCFRLSLV